MSGEEGGDAYFVHFYLRTNNFPMSESSICLDSLYHVLYCFILVHYFSHWEQKSKKKEGGTYFFQKTFITKNIFRKVVTYQTKYHLLI